MLGCEEAQAADEDYPGGGGLEKEALVETNA